jgi:TRAP-type C4-dicarboxylate transport system permease small subunit
VNAVIRLLGRINDAILWVSRQTAWVFLVTMTAMILVQVFFRYVLNDSLSWTEELARFMMMWLTFLVAPLALRHGANVGIELVIGQFRGRPRFLLEAIILIVLIATLLVFLNQSLGIVERNWDQRATAVRYPTFGLIDVYEGSTATMRPLPMAIVYLCLPVGLIGMISVALELLLIQLRALVNPQTYRPARPAFASYE